MLSKQGPQVPQKLSFIKSLKIQYPPPIPGIKKWLPYQILGGKTVGKVIGSILGPNRGIDKYIKIKVVPTAAKWSGPKYESNKPLFLTLDKLS